MGAKEVRGNEGGHRVPPRPAAVAPVFTGHFRWTAASSFCLPSVMPVTIVVVAAVVILARSTQDRPGPPKPIEGKGQAALPWLIRSPAAALGCRACTLALSCCSKSTTCGD